jgi:uncharacterized protein YbdZ (MbtH family)
MSIRRVGSTDEKQAVDNDCLFVRLNDDQQHRLRPAFADGTARGRMARREATRAAGLACIERNFADIQPRNPPDPTRDQSFTT